MATMCQALADAADIHHRRAVASIPVDLPKALIAAVIARFVRLPSPRLEGEIPRFADCRPIPSRPKAKLWRPRGLGRRLHHDVAAGVGNGDGRAAAL